MKKGSKIIFCFLLGLLLTGNLAFAQEDAKGCKDHPLFSRMQGYRIVVCQEKEFDAEDFIDPATQQKVTIEGRKFHTEYVTGWRQSTALGSNHGEENWGRVQIL